MVRLSEMQKGKSPLESFHMVSTYYMLPSFITQKYTLFKAKKWKLFQR